MDHKGGQQLQEILTAQNDAILEQQLLEASKKLMNDEEPRVRLAAGECLGLLAKLQGVSVWMHCRQVLYDSIRRDYVGRALSLQLTGWDWRRGRCHFCLMICAMDEMLILKYCTSM